MARDPVNSNGLKPQKGPPDDVHFLPVRDHSSLGHQTPDVLAGCRVGNDTPLAPIDASWLLQSSCWPFHHREKSKPQALDKVGDEGVSPSPSHDCPLSWTPLPFSMGWQLRERISSAIICRKNLPLRPINTPRSSDEHRARVYGRYRTEPGHQVAASFVRGSDRNVFSSVLSGWTHS